VSPVVSEQCALVVHEPPAGRIASPQGCPPGPSPAGIGVPADQDETFTNDAAREGMDLDNGLVPAFRAEKFQN
jgi:hypothetical protein